jgi:crotonobetainyl-CoA:carnitine CoA-transferase CaiB-like acyl-CoA transferase
MDITGDNSPMKFGVPIVDLTCGINLAFGITTALYNRSITNQVLNYF